MLTNRMKEDRIAWLLPAMGTGGISFQHLLSEFSQVFPHTTAFTGQWPGYAPGLEDTFTVQEVGATRYIELGTMANGYAVGFSYASPQIIRCLLQFKTQVIFANAFTAWTAIALLLKPIGRWKVIITYEGGSSTYENPSASIRYRVRRVMAKLADAFVVNGRTGKAYLLDVLQVQPERVFARPFLVPSLKVLTHYDETEAPQLANDLKRPIFLYVGQIIPRKGLKNLLAACMLLKQKGYDNYTLMVVGDGEQRSELETFVCESGLEQQIHWVGKVSYRFLGAYFQFADVFVFPTYDDIWGMVLTEAMAFGKPVICSTGAGAAEMVQEAENGFLYAPEAIEALAEKMQKFLNTPELIAQMGERSLKIMQQHSPAQATQAFIQAVHFIQQG